MNDFTFRQRLFAAIAGSYSGNLVASGVGEIFGVEWNGGVWWDWIAASVIIATCISLPLALLLLYLLVPFVHKSICRNRTICGVPQFITAGAVSGAVPVIAGYGVNWVYSAVCCSLTGVAGTLPSLFVLLSHAMLVGSFCLLFLNYLVAEKS